MRTAPCAYPTRKASVWTGHARLARGHAQGDLGGNLIDVTGLKAQRDGIG